MLWQLVSSKAPLHGNPIVCWKFLHVLHKVSRILFWKRLKTLVIHDVFFLNLTFFFLSNIFVQVIREGHPNCVKEAGKHRGLIEDLGKLWGIYSGYIIYDM